MKKFQFRLTALLRIREGLARQEENHLARLFAERAGIERARAEIRERREQLHASRQEALRLGTTAAEIGWGVVCAHNLTEAERETDRQEMELVTRLEAQQKKFATARRELEKLRRFRNAEWESWQRTQTRREQKMNDELFLLHRTNPIV